MNRGKPQPNIQSINKPIQQNIPAKIAPGNPGKPANIPNLSQPQVIKYFHYIQDRMFIYKSLLYFR